VAERISRTQVEKALAERLLLPVSPEHPNSQIHRFIESKAPRLVCPKDPAGWERQASNLRRRFLEEVFLKGHPSDLLEEEPRTIEKGTIETGRGYRIRKLLYEGFPGMWIPALLYEPTGIEGPLPAVLNPNGHHAGGKAVVYKQARCINLAKRGMLAMSPEFIGMGELSMNQPHYRLAHLDLCGRAGAAIFYLAVKRALDVLLSHPMCDPSRVAVTGLSGGGWQTIVIGALDTRVKAIIPVAGHSPIWQRVSLTADIGDLEQTPVDFCTVADYDALTALCAPRPLLLIYNKRDDCCFRSDRTRESVYAPVEPVYRLLGKADMIEFYENADPGTHNYESDNRAQLYRFLNKHFGLSHPEQDLPYEDEILSEYELEVGLPEENATLLSIALEASRGLGRQKIPAPGPDRTTWIQEARKRLADVIKLRRYTVHDTPLSQTDFVEQHILRLSEDWELPATVLNAADEPTQTYLLLSDQGRPSVAPAAFEHIEGGQEVVAVDVFGTGELAFPPQYQMLVSTVGERPLGILTGQILSLVDWLSSTRDGRVWLVSSGCVVSFASLCAAALQPTGLSGIRLGGMYDSLRRLVELPLDYLSAVPLFCFGLLEEFDVPQLLAMAEGIRIERDGHGPVTPVTQAR